MRTKTESRECSLPLVWLTERRQLIEINVCEWVGGGGERGPDWQRVSRTHDRWREQLGAERAREQVVGARGRGEEFNVTGVVLGETAD